MKKVVQTIFGIGFLIFGLNKFLEFMPMPEMRGSAAEFMSVIFNSYIWPVLGGTMILGGLSAIINKYTALMLVVLAPITLNILLFHVFFDFKGLGMGLVFFLIHMYLLFQYKKSYTLMLKSCSGMGCKIN